MAEATATGATDAVKPEPAAAPAAPADADAAPQAGATSPAPSTADLEAAVAEFLKGQDLQQTTTKMVRAHLESKFGCSMAPYKGVPLLRAAYVCRMDSARTDSRASRQPMCLGSPPTG